MIENGGLRRALQVREPVGDGATVTTQRWDVAAMSRGAAPCVTRERRRSLEVAAMRRGAVPCVKREGRRRSFGDCVWKTNALATAFTPWMYAMGLNTQPQEGGGPTAFEEGW